MSSGSVKQRPKRVVSDGSGLLTLWRAEGQTDGGMRVTLILEGGPCDRDMSMMLGSRRFVLAALCSAMLLPAGAFAQSAAPQTAVSAATAPVGTLNAGLIAVMKAGDQTSFLQRFQTLAPIVDQAFDLSRILRVSVGSYWSGLPAAQQQKLEQVFRSFIIATYVANFHNYGGEVSSISPQTRAVGNEQVVTSSLAKPSGGDGLRIDYVMGEGSAGWKIQDILLDGTISRVAVQRSDFASLLSDGNATQLIDSLQQKVSTLSAGAISS